MAALERHLPGARPAGVAAGLNVTVRLPGNADEQAFLTAARARGVGLAGLSEHRLGAGPPTLLLGYGRIAEPTIERGVKELAAAIKGD